MLFYNEGLWQPSVNPQKLTDITVSRTLTLFPMCDDDEKKVKVGECVYEICWCHWQHGRNTDPPRCEVTDPRNHKCICNWFHSEARRNVRGCKHVHTDDCADSECWMNHQHPGDTPRIAKARKAEGRELSFWLHSHGFLERTSLKDARRLKRTHRDKPVQK